MRKELSNRTRHGALTVSIAISTLLLLIGCGNEGERTVRIIPPADTGVAFAAAGPVEEAGGAVIGIFRSGAYTSYLVDAHGRSLYVFLPDADVSGSECGNECSEDWPPYLTNGDPVAGEPAVEEQKISTITRDDGSIQLSYNGLPLYYYAADEEPGETAGHGLESFGGEWYLISPEGDPVERRVDGY